MTADIETTLDLCGQALREALDPSRGQGAPVLAVAAIRAALIDLVRLAEAPAIGLPREPGQDNVVPLGPEPTVAEGHALTTAFLRIRDARARSTLLALADHLAD